MNNDFGRFELEQAHARARTELASAQRDVEAVERAAAVNLDADEGGTRQRTTRAGEGEARSCTKKPLRLSTRSAQKCAGQRVKPK
jgi:hypothetical protein